MKKFLASLLIGGFVGTIFGLGFIFVAPKLPDIFAYSLFMNIDESPVTVVKNFQNLFKDSNGQYIIKSEDEEIENSPKVVYANLSSMSIIAFENGQNVGEYQIKSIGREGTAWQTPLGRFDMSFKKKNHYSSIGHVYMPYSMHFFGNYFIHGWPYYEGGTPVAEGYSGGCIRLSTEDAEKLFGFVDKDTKLVIVSSSDEIDFSENLKYDSKNSLPDISSRFVVADIETGEVVASKNPKEVVSIDSFAKLMTALISLETLNQYQDTVFDQDIVKVSDVIYSLLISDNDDAGKVLEQHKNKSQYLIDMNTRAKSIGMKDTKYLDVNGSVDGTVSSLEDTFRLVQYINWYKPFLIKLMSLDSYKMKDVEFNSNHPLNNENYFVAGFANIEGEEMITIVTADIKNDKSGELEKKSFVIIVHGSADAKSDTLKLYEWLGRSVVIK